LNIALAQLRRQPAPPIPTLPPGHWDSYPQIDSRLDDGLPCTTGNDAARLIGLMGGRRKLRQGECLYRNGEPFRYLYGIHSGSFKSALSLADGCEQVSNFHMNGEFLGLDGVAESLHASTATALEDSEVYSLSYAHLGEICATAGGMQSTVMRLISREFVRSNVHMAVLGSLNSAQRMASFLLLQSQQQHARGYSAVEFHLKMTRGEIGSFLGMTLETVSRTLTELQLQRLVKVDRRHIVIFSLDALAQV
jgi:CRP/FNR family transcriptional regulator